MTRSRRLRLGLLTSGVGLAGAVVVVLLLQVFSQPGLRRRWDWTQAAATGLSDRTQAALAALPEESRATFFLFPEESRYLVNGSAVYPRAFSVLRTAAEEARIASNGRLAVDVFDRSSSLNALEQARTRLDRQPGETVILEVEGRRQVLPFEELFVVHEPNLETGAPARIRSQRVDTALGDATNRLARARLPRIAVLAAYRGEASSSALLQEVMDLYAGEGFEVDAVELVPAADGEYDLLVVPGQTEPFRSGDEDAARAWLASDRALCVALGALAPPEVASFWNELLDERGIRFESGQACDRWRGQVGVNRCGNLEIPPERLSPLHPVTRRLNEERRVLGELLLTRPLAIAGGSNAFGREQLAWLARSAWVEIEQDSAEPFDWQPGPGERRGPFPVAAAAERWEEGPARLPGRTLVLGSTSPFYVRVPLFRDFHAAAVRWLLGEDAGTAGLVGLESVPYRPTREQRARLANLSVIALPGSAFLLGFLVFWRRRR